MLFLYIFDFIFTFEIFIVSGICTGIKYDIRILCAFKMTPEFTQFLLKNPNYFL